MRHASGYRRRDFGNGVWRTDELASMEAGHEVRTRIPAEYWKQDERTVPLDELPLFWEHNKTQFDNKWLYAFNQRLVQDYLKLCMDGQPGFYSDDDGRSEDDFLERQERFFESVRAIETFKFWEYVPQTRFRPQKSLVTTVFTDTVPEYAQYRRDHDSELHGQGCLYDGVPVRSRRSDAELDKAFAAIMADEAREYETRYGADVPH